MRPVCIAIEVELFLELFSQYSEALFLGVHGFCDDFDDELGNIVTIDRSSSFLHPIRVSIVFHVCDWV